MWNNLEDAFKEIDAREFDFVAKALAAYRRSLTGEGFSQREAMRLVEGYAKYIYDMSLEEFIAQKNSEQIDGLINPKDDDVDPDDDDELR